MASREEKKKQARCALCQRLGDSQASCASCRGIVCPICFAAYERAYEKLCATVPLVCPVIECSGELTLVAGLGKETVVDETKIATATQEEKKENPNEIKLIRVRREEADYKRIEQMFYPGAGATVAQHFKLSAVFRIINKPIETVFAACKARMDKEGRKIGKREVGANEKLLFHGTTRAAIGGIVREGFDMRRAGAAHGTALGPGAYFAADSWTSMGYVKRDGHGGLAMLICRVLVGAPVRDAVHSGNVFVVNREQQILPVYVLHITAGA